MWLIPLVVQQKLIQRWKAVTFQLKMKANGKEPTHKYYRPLLGNYIWWKTANRPTKYWWEVDIVLIQIIIPQSEKFSDILGVSKTKITYHAQTITERIIKGFFFFFQLETLTCTVWKEGFWDLTWVDKLYLMYYHFLHFSISDTCYRAL